MASLPEVAETVPVVETPNRTPVFRARRPCKTYVIGEVEVRALRDVDLDIYARGRTLIERSAATAQALERAELAIRTADRDMIAAEFQNHAAEHELDQARALLAQYGDGAEPPERGTSSRRSPAWCGG